MEQLTVTIESVDFEGKGIARVDGKTVFVQGAMTGEEVVIELARRKKKYDMAFVEKIIKPSPYRVEPQCKHYAICGGCSTQHIEFNEQIKIKQQVLVDNLQYIGQVVSEDILPPLVGSPWHYRHRARMSVRNVLKKGRVLVGFREKASPFVADMDSCEVLAEDISNLIPHLREMILTLDARDTIPQIEVAVGDKVNVLVIRNMEQLSGGDEDKLKLFVDSKSSSLSKPLQLWLQPKGPDSCYKFYPLDAPELSYSISKYSITMPYYPTEFTQVNPLINNQMMELALQLLQPTENEVIADFFCGIGNFSLPIAKYAKTVVGIEGSEQLVLRAKQNAEYNNLSHKVSYQVCNLFTIDEKWLADLGSFDKWLIDPPRDGAMALVSSITDATKPKLIVYVSCNPATLARDAGILVNQKGYRLVTSGVMNMFPHTSHVESIALFVI